MENSEKAKWIIKIQKDMVSKALSDDIKAQAELSQAVTGHNLWEKQQDSFDFSRNPYNIDRATEVAKRTSGELQAREEILDYAIDTFLSMIPDETA